MAASPAELHVPRDAVVGCRGAKLLDGEKRVGISHQRVVFRVDLAELAGIGLVLAEIEARFAEEVLVLSVADGSVGGMDVIGLAPGRTAAGGPQRFSCDLPGVR